MMAYIAVECPECLRGLAVNGSTVCNCGARLFTAYPKVHFVGEQSRTWVIHQGKWHTFVDWVNIIAKKAAKAVASNTFAGSVVNGPVVAGDSFKN